MPSEESESLCEHIHQVPVLGRRVWLIAGSESVVQAQGPEPARPGSRSRGAVRLHQQETCPTSYPSSSRLETTNDAKFLAHLRC